MQRRRLGRTDMEVSAIGFGADVRADLTKLGLSAADVDAIVGKMPKPRVSSGKSIRAARAAGDGGICPYFGQDYETSEGIHHPADCGKEHDGKFAKTGDRIKGTGYLGHIAWAEKGAPVIKTKKH